jgi:hypothetical protein
VVKGVLSACAEDHGLCPWMNAQNVAESFTYRTIDAPADFANLFLALPAKLIIDDS